MHRKSACHLRAVIAALSLFCVIYGPLQPIAFVKGKQGARKPLRSVLDQDANASDGLDPLGIEVTVHGVQHWSKLKATSISPVSSMLVLAMTHDESSWGSNADENVPRTTASFFELLASTDIPVEQMAVGLLTSSASSYNEMKFALGTSSLQQGQVILHPGFGSTGRGARHDDSLQTERRRNIARLRNYLMLRTLNNEAHIVWLDADVYWLQPGIIQEFIRQSSEIPASSRQQAGIITARCSQGRNIDYDLNAWSGPRKEPSQRQINAQNGKNSFIPQPTSTTKFFSKLLEGTSDNELVHLDSVGGTILYINSILIRQGLTFPVYLTVGTTWKSKEGWDGIETEGLCYIARTLGYGCYGLAGSWHVKHTDQ